MEIRYYIRKTQLLDLYGNPIIAVGSAPNSVSIVAGVLPNNNWIEITGDIDPDTPLSVTITSKRDSSGVEAEAGVTFLKKVASGTLRLSGASYAFIKDWIYNSPTTIYNSFMVRIEDGCGAYEDFVIKRSNIIYCEDGVCEFSLNLTQRDEVYACIQKTLVADNWQGWFQDEPLGGKKYPRFSYCVEPNNKSIMILVWYLAITTTLTSGWIIFMMGTVLNTIYAILRVINTIVKALGSDGFDVPDPISGDMAATPISSIILESAGCTREHPAAFIRDYIQNVCMKCGVDVDETTVPVFFAKTLNMNTGFSGSGTFQNHHYNATYFWPSKKEGSRRYKDFWASLTFNDPDNTTVYDPANAVNVALSDFLDRIAPIYNSEWRVRLVNGRPTLFFLRKDWYYQGNYVYNFQQGSSDRAKIVEGICFTPIDIKYPASVDGIYSNDGMEDANVAVKDAYDGKAYNFGQLTENNPVFSGILGDKSKWIAPTRFGHDGSEADYIYDAFQIAINGVAFSYLVLGMSLTNPFWMNALHDICVKVTDDIKKYCNYAIYMKQHTTAAARIIIWDGVDWQNSRAIRLKRGFPTNVSPLPDPTPFPLYNTQGFNALHPRETKVRGLGLTYGHSPAGVFQIKSITGMVYASTPCELSNWPMYFNPGFEGTLWDWFWFIEDPRFRQNMGLGWEVKIENCCEDRLHLGVYTNSSNLRLGELIKLPLPFLYDGIIREITVDYSSKENIGRLITIKGTV